MQNCTWKIHKKVWTSTLTTWVLSVHTNTIKNTVLIWLFTCLHAHEHTHTHVCILIICSQRKAPLPAGGGWWHLAGEQQFQLATLVSVCKCVCEFVSVCTACVCDDLQNTLLTLDYLPIGCPERVWKEGLVWSNQSCKKEAIAAWFKSPDPFACICNKCLFVRWHFITGKDSQRKHKMIPGVWYFTAYDYVFTDVDAINKSETFP